MEEKVEHIYRKVELSPLMIATALNPYAETVNSIDDVNSFSYFNASDTIKEEHACRVMSQFNLIAEFTKYVPNNAVESLNREISEQIQLIDTLLKIYDVYRLQEVENDIVSLINNAKDLISNLKTGLILPIDTDTRLKTVRTTISEIKILASDLDMYFTNLKQKISTQIYPSSTELTKVTFNNKINIEILSSFVSELKQSDLMQSQFYKFDKALRSGSFKNIRNIISELHTYYNKCKNTYMELKNKLNDLYKILNTFETLSFEVDNNNLLQDAVIGTEKTYFFNKNNFKLLTIYVSKLSNLISKISFVLRYENVNKEDYDNTLILNKLDFPYGKPSLLFVLSMRNKLIKMKEKLNVTLARDITLSDVNISYDNIPFKDIMLSIDKLPDYVNQSMEKPVKKYLANRQINNIEDCMHLYRYLINIYSQRLKEIEEMTQNIDYKLQVLTGFGGDSADSLSKTIFEKEKMNEFKEFVMNIMGHIANLQYAGYYQKYVFSNTILEGFYYLMSKGIDTQIPPMLDISIKNKDLAIEEIFVLEYFKHILYHFGFDIDIEEKHKRFKETAKYEKGTLNNKDLLAKIKRYQLLQNNINNLVSDIENRIYCLNNSIQNCNDEYYKIFIANEAYKVLKLS